MKRRSLPSHENGPANQQRNPRKSGDRGLHRMDTVITAFRKDLRGCGDQWRCAIGIEFKPSGASLAE
jgi:hypothetical protein